MMEFDDDSESSSSYASDVECYIPGKWHKDGPPIEVQRVDEQFIQSYYRHADRGEDAIDFVPSLTDKRMLVCVRGETCFLIRELDSGELLLAACVSKNSHRIDFKLYNTMSTNYPCVSVVWLQRLAALVRKARPGERQLNVVCMANMTTHVFWVAKWFGYYANWITLDGIVVSEDNVRAWCTVIVPNATMCPYFPYAFFGDELTPEFAHKLFERFTRAHLSVYSCTINHQGVFAIRGRIVMVFDDDNRFVERFKIGFDGQTRVKVVVANVNCSSLTMGKLQLNTVVALNAACHGIQQFRRNSYFFVRLAQQILRFKPFDKPVQLACVVKPNEVTIARRTKSTGTGTFRRPLIRLMHNAVDGVPETAHSHWCHELAPRLYELARIFGGFLPAYTLLEIVDWLPEFRFVPHVSKIKLLAGYSRSLRALLDNRRTHKPAHQERTEKRARTPPAMSSTEQESKPAEPTAEANQPEMTDEQKEKRSAMLAAIKDKGADAGGEKADGGDK